MAATIFSFYTCCSLIFHLQLLILFVRTNGAPLDDICSQTVDPSFCLQAFATDPRSGTADLATLAQIALDNAEYDAANAKIEIGDRIAFEKDPTLKSLYIQCENFYYDSLDALQAAPGDLEQGNYVDLKKQAVAIRTGVDGCETVFNHNSPVASASRIVGIFGDAVGLIADELSR